MEGDCFAYFGANNLQHSEIFSILKVGSGTWPYAKVMGFLLSLFYSLVGPSFPHPSTHSPPPRPHVQLFLFHEVEWFISASTFTSNLVYVNNIIMLRKLKDSPVSRMHTPYKVMLTC